MAYVYLLGAILAEVLGTSQIRSTEGFTRLWPALTGLLSYGVAFVLLSLAIHRGMSVSVGYALWSGLGTALIVAVGAVFLSEAVTVTKLAGIALVVAGVVVLNASGAP